MFHIFCNILSFYKHGKCEKKVISEGVQWWNYLFGPNNIVSIHPAKALVVWYGEWAQVLIQFTAQMQWHQTPQHHYLGETLESCAQALHPTVVQLQTDPESHSSSCTICYFYNLYQRHHWSFKLGETHHDPICTKAKTTCFSPGRKEKC